MNRNIKAKKHIRGLDASFDREKTRRRRRLRVELLEDRRLLAADFGDAPITFPVLLEDDGARHETPLAWAEVGAEINSGWVVSLAGDGSTLAVGEPFTDFNGTVTGVGRTRVYRRIDSAWRMLGGEITGQNTQDGFGWAISLSEDGSTVAIGAPFNDTNGNDSGQTYVFRWSGAEWQQLGNVINGEAGGTNLLTPGDRSGWAISLNSNGNTVAIGAPYNDGNGTDAGHTRVFRWDGRAWQQLGSDIDGQPGPMGSTYPGDSLGSSVSLSGDGNTLAVNFSNYRRAGGRIFQWNGSTWQTLGSDIDIGAPPHGVALSADGTTVAIDTVDQNIGQTWLFRQDGSSWQQVGAPIKGEPSNCTAISPGLKRSLSLDARGNTVAIGVSNNCGNGYATNAGHARVFRLDGMTWRQIGMDIDGPLLDGGQGGFGRSIQLSADGRSLAVGATLPASGGLGGASEFNTARVYHWSPLEWQQLGSDFDSEYWDQAGWSVATNQTGNTVAVAAPYKDGDGVAAGHVKVYRYDGVNWLQMGDAFDGRPTYWGQATDQIRAASQNQRVSVDISDDGNTVAVGAMGNGFPVHGGSGDEYGLTRIFHWDGSSWQQLGKDILGEEMLAAPSPLSSSPEKFAHAGWSVALSSSGRIVAIGAPLNDGNGELTGHVRVYGWDGTEWSQYGNDIDGRFVETLPGQQPVNDYFGASVALSADGQTLAIGAPGRAHFAGLLPISPGRTEIYRWNGTAWHKLGQEIAGDLGNNVSGWSVSLSEDGNTVAIGAPATNTNGFTGRTRIYTWNGTSWQILGANIDAQIQSENSGWSVSLSSDGKRVAIGAPHGSNARGLARIYEWDGLNWQQLGASIHGEKNYAYAGWSVSMSGDGNTVTLGAPFHNSAQHGFGRTQVHRWNGGNWEQLGGNIDGESNGDGFGTSITYSADGTTMAVGAPHVYVDAIHYGSRTRIYRRQADTWQQLGQEINGKADRDWAGWSVSLSADGNTVAIGAPFFKDQNESGYAQIFRWDGSTWSQMGSDLVGLSTGDAFGWSLSLNADGETVAIGAAATGISYGRRAGYTRIFQWTGTTWQQLGDQIDGEENYDQSGWSVSLAADGASVAIGAPLNSGTGNDAGHTRIYRWDGIAWKQLGDDIDGEAAGDTSGWSVSLTADGNTVAVGAPRNNGNAGDKRSGHVRVYRWDGASWQQQGSDLDGQMPGDESGWSVSLSANGNLIAIGAPGDEDAFGDEDAVGNGHARIYRWDGASWLRVGSDIIGRPLWRGFGRAVSLTADGSSVAIGATQELYRTGAIVAQPRGYAKVYRLPPRLGVARDLEADGFPTTDASGDGDDEDGIVFGSLRAGHISEIDLLVTGSSGLIDAWIDFNADGHWTDDEQIFTAEPVKVGWNELRVEVPIDVVASEAFARFRLSRVAGLQPGGTSADGEVEDYLLAINAAPTLDPLADLSIDEDASDFTVDLSGITAGADEAQALKVTAISSNTDLILDPTVSYTSANPTGTLAFTPLANQSGTATIIVTVEDAGFDNELATTADNATFSRTFDVVVKPVNDKPTLDSLDNLTIDEDAAEQTVNLAGITAGVDEAQALKVTAISSNTGLIHDPTVSYTSANPTGALAFTPLANQYGTATITVTVEDAGLDNDFATTGDNATVSRTFDVIVTPVNDDPTLDSLDNLTIDEDAAEQTVNLAGITTGADDEVQTIEVTATSSNTSLILDPTVTYTSANPTGTLAFTPLADQSGTATITVTVEDAGLDNNLATTGDNATFSRTFDIIVTPVNDDPTLDSLDDLTIDEDAAAQMVNLTGITAGADDEVQTIEVTATSDNDALIPDPAVTYTSGDSTGSLSFTPVANQSGTATITVTVEDAGLDNDFATTADNATISRTVVVIGKAINDAPTLDALDDLEIDEDAPLQSIQLAGISSGPFESEALRITATSDNTNVIPDPAVTYTSGDSTGSLSFTPVANESGIATITVTVEDAGLDNDFATVADNSQYSQGFVVAVGMSTFVVDPNVITLELRGHEQTLSIFRQTDDISLNLKDGLWSGVQVDGVTGNNSPTLIMPASKLRDRVEIITTSDQSFHTPTSSLWVLGTWDPIESPTFRTMVLESDRQSVFHVAGQKPWKNFVSPHDINNDGKTSVLDALTIINELARGDFVDLDTNQLTPPSELSEWPDVYYDTNGDDRGTTFDALLVINELARLGNSSGEGELTDVAIEQWGRDLTPISTAKPTSDPITQTPNSRSRIFTSSSEAASYVSSPQVVDAEYESMGSESLKDLDESLLSLLAE